MDTRPCFLGCIIRSRAGKIETTLKNDVIQAIEDQLPEEKNY